MAGKVTAKQKKKYSIVSGLFAAEEKAARAEPEPQIEFKGLELGPVRHVEVKSLREHKDNPMPALTGEEYASLKSDIENQGVLVPLVVTEESEVLDGHNRLRVAKELGFEKVPVQRVERELTKNEELGLLFKFNSLRRQTTPEMRMASYYKIPGFEKELLKDKRGGNQSKSSTELSLEKSDSLAKKVSDLTGFSESTVKRDLAKMREEKRREEAKKADKPKPETKVHRLQIRLEKKNEQIDKLTERLKKLKDERKAISKELKGVTQ